MTQWLIDNKDLATLVFAAVVTVSTAVYALLTGFLVFETRRMRRAQTEPKISSYFQPIEEYVNFGHLHVKNIGLGPAFDITISIESVGSEEGGKLLVKDFSRAKFINKGVNYLGPGQSLKSGYTSMAENPTEKIKSVLNVNISYKSADGRLHKVLYRIDFAELEGYGSLGKPHLYSIAQSLEKIQKDVGHMFTGFRNLKVDIFDHDDRERKKRVWEEARESHTKKNAEDISGDGV